MASSGISFEHVWQQDDMSDLDLVLTASTETQNEGDEAQILRKFPAHSLILSNSPFLKAQIARWQLKRAHTDGEDGSSSSTAAGRRQLVLTLQDADQEPAAMAVLSALYLVKPVAELLSELPQEQQLHAVLLADMWQVPGVSTATVQLLLAAAQGTGGLTDAAIKQYLGLEAHPDCLLPLLPHTAAAVLRPGQQFDIQVKVALKRMLLRVLGDLEGVWADAALRNILLQLPLPAMALLLSCGDLKVASEDTVLYTAQTFVDAITDSRLQAAAKSHLARLVRCPHLSMFWLSALALSPDAPRLLMSAQQDELKQLLMLHHGGLASDCMQQEFNTHLPRVPLSWNLPARASSPVSSVQLVWKLDVAAVASAGRESALKQKCIMLRSPYYTPPLGGLVFDLALYADSSAEPRGSCFAFFAAAKNAPVGTFYKYHISVSIMGDVVLSDNSDMLNSGQDWGRTDTFRLGVMAEGWDEAAWASKGWPTSGELVVSATFKQIAPSAA